MTAKLKRHPGFSDLFSFGLYLQGMKKLLIPGIVAFIVIIVPAFFSLICCICMRLFLYSIGADETSDIILLVVIAEYVFTPLSSYLMITLFATASVLIVFSFLNKRRDCDFYHALPCSRLCLFNSLYFAAITWVMTIFVSFSLLTVSSRLILYSINEEYVQQYATIAIPFMLSAILAVLLVMATLVFAKSITGTLVSNVLALISVTVSFFTTFALLAIHFYLTAPMVLTYTGINLLSAYDIPSLMLDSFTEQGFGSPLFYIYISIMSVILLIYSIIAAMAFCRRRSEISGRATINSVSLHLLCGLFVLPVFINALSIIHSFDLSLIISCIFASIGPIITFLVLELILSKSFIKMLKSIPALILTVTIALSCVLGVNVAGDIGEKHILQSLPEADEIKSITVAYDIEQMSFAPDCNLTNYDELEFLSSRIKQYYESYDEYESYTSQSAKIVLKNGKEKTYKFDMSHDDQVLLNSITDSNMCIAFLRNALYSDRAVTTYDSERFPVSTCTTKIAYLDNNGKLCRFTADEELLKVMLSELEAMSAFDRTSINNVSSNYAYSNREELKQNKYGIMIRIAIDPEAIEIGSNVTYYAFFADAESYPIIYDAIENHIATEYLQN